jgi:hypothetical protein
MPDLSAASPMTPPKRVDLSHEVAFTQAADRRVAGHHADPIPTASQAPLTPSTRSGAGRLHPGVPASDHDDIEPSHVSRETPLFPDTEGRKDLAQHRLYIDTTRQRVKRPDRSADFLGREFRRIVFSQKQSCAFQAPQQPICIGKRDAASCVAVPTFANLSARIFPNRSSKSSTPAPVRPDTPPGAQHRPACRAPDMSLDQKSVVTASSFSIEIHTRRSALPARLTCAPLRSFRQRPRCPADPAVSSSVTGIPSRSSRTSITSRVVPARYGR